MTSARTLATALVLALAFSLGVPVFAQTPAQTPAKKKKKKDADASTAPAPAPAAPAPSAKAKGERTGPAKFEEKAKPEDAEKDAMADQKRDEEIVQLKIIIPKFEDGAPQKADLLFQLSELYWEKSKYLFRTEMRKFGEEEAKYDAARNRGEKLKEPKEEHRQSELFRTETMRLYETVLREYPSYERKDEVLFDLAYNQFEIGKKDAAVKRYNELIKNYPTSKFVPDTYVQLGNYYFDVKNDLEHARENYQKAFKSEVAKIKSYALYKLAWCDYNDHAYDASLTKMQQVVDFAEKNGKEMVDLKNEALNDMVAMFVQLNRADDAIAYFKRKAGKKRQIRLMSKMAYQLADAGHFENAVKTFRMLIGDSPLGAEAPEFQQQIAKSYEGLRQRDNVKKEIKLLVDTYRPGSEWWVANASKQDVIRNAFNVTEEAMRGMVTEYHQEAQKTKQVDTYRLARDIYKQYVDAFASSADPNFVSDFAFDMRFYYAEILWALEEWDNAATAYDQVVKFKIPDRESAKEASHDSKYRQQAAYDELLAYEKLVKIERGLLAKTDLKEGQKVDEQKKKGSVEKGQKITKRSAKELEEKPITKYEEALVAACDQYNSSYPSNPDEIDVRYQAAVIYYDKNHFVDAAKRFGEIILKWPEEHRSQDAADLSMSVLEERQEWQELNKLARQFQANKKLAKAGSEFTKRVGNVVEGSQYKWVDEVIYKKEKNPAKAAEEFLKFVAEFPKSDNADRALTYAMIIFKDANQIDRGIQTGERVLTEYKGSPFELKVRFTLAKFYEQTADFEKSARMYEEFLAAYDDATDGKDLPADLKKDWEKAKKAAAAKKPAKVAKVEKRKFDEKEQKALLEEAKGWLADAQFNAALWWEGLAQTDKAVADYSTYLQRFKDKKDVPDIHFNIGSVYEKAKRWADAIKTFDTFATLYAKDSRCTAGQLYLARYRQFLDYKQLDDAKNQGKAMDELLRGFAKLPADGKKDPKVVDAYAHARFANLEPQWKAYLDLKVKLATFPKDRGLKEKRLDDLQKAYTEVLNLGAGEWGIAAVTRIGLGYVDFAQTLTDVPAPKKFDEDQKEIFRQQLEEKAQPLEDKAIEAFESALTTAYKLSIYSEWTLLAQERINKYRPGAYPKVREVPFQGSEFFATAPLLKAATVADAPKTDNPGQPTASRGGGAGAR